MTPDRERLRELAERCEKATAEEQRHLLREAWQLVNGEWPDAGDWTLGHATKRFARMIEAEAYESAAMTLVPEECFPLLDFRGVHCRMRDARGNDIGSHGFATTAALALTAACLRSHATKESDHA